MHRLRRIRTAIIVLAAPLIAVAAAIASGALPGSNGSGAEPTVAERAAAYALPSAGRDPLAGNEPATANVAQDTHVITDLDEVRALVREHLGFDVELLPAANARGRDLVLAEGEHFGTVALAEPVEIRKAGPDENVKGRLLSPLDNAKARDNLWMVVVESTFPGGASPGVETADSARQVDAPSESLFVMFVDGDTGEMVIGLAYASS